MSETITIYKSEYDSAVKALNQARPILDEHLKLKSELTALRKENEELKSEIKSLEWAEKCLAEAGAAEMRKAFERILIFEISPQEYDIIEVWKIARDTLSLDVGKDFLKRYEAMRDVIEAARLLSPHTLFHNPEIRDALSALDALGKEGGV